MLSYTKGTLKTALTIWNVNSDPDFVATLDEIIRRGEVRLTKELDLDAVYSVNDTFTTTLSALAFKPLNMINERLVLMSIAGKNATILKRSRSWVERYNEDSLAGSPKFYCEYDEDRWAFAPIPDASYIVTVHGNYTFASIVDGDDNTQTWFSTRAPDLLYIACSIEANDFLKAWAKRDLNLADLESQSTTFMGVAENLRSAAARAVTRPQPGNG